MLHVFALFHLNIFYSSIDIEQRGEVLRRCYWPLLHLAQDLQIPVGVEASGYTLETLYQIDPLWVDKLRQLCRTGLCEFIGSGYAQIIGPLVPAEVNEANLRIGNRIYQELLNVQPAVALVNEQAFSAGMVQHYRRAGYRAIVMEWDNAAAAHPEWPASLRFLPQRAVGPGGESIPLLWSHSIAFQKFQRYAHGELSLPEIIAYLGSQEGGASRVFCVYTNDAEVFDFRPGRYATEPPRHSEGEWNRIRRFLNAAEKDHRFRWIKPSDAIKFLDEPGAGTPLRLESPPQPIPVKKQPKYNPTRWAVTGRNDLWANTLCWRVYEGLKRLGETSDEAWKELCYLWSSDFRTHITPKRWRSFKARLRKAEKKWVHVTGAESRRAPHVSPGFTTAKGPLAQIRRDGRFLEVETDAVRVRLNCKKGLAVQALWFKEIDEEHPLCGTLPHGYYEDIRWGADFFTGHLVFQRPARPQITDLVPVDPEINTDPQFGTITVVARIPSHLGQIRKVIEIRMGCRASITCGHRLDWKKIPRGSLRVGHVLLNPEAFDIESLFYKTTNGGFAPEVFPLRGHPVNHGEAVDFRVSARHCLGVTEGFVALGDKTKHLLVTVDKAASSLVGLMTHKVIGKSYFCRLSFSAAEMDETRGPHRGDFSSSITITAWTENNSTEQEQFNASGHHKERHNHG